MFDHDDLPSGQLPPLHFDGHHYRQNHVWTNLPWDRVLSLPGVVCLHACADIALSKSQRSEDKRPDCGRGIGRHQHGLVLCECTLGFPHLQTFINNAQTKPPRAWKSEFLKSQTSPYTCSNLLESWHHWWSLSSYSFLILNSIVASKGKSLIKVPFRHIPVNQITWSY